MLATICTSVSAGFDRLVVDGRRQIPPGTRRVARSRGTGRSRWSRARCRGRRYACRASLRCERLLLRQAAALRLLGGDLVGLAEVDAAGERVLAVDHDDLAMIAMVDAGEALVERVQRIERAERDAGFAQALEKFLVGRQ